MQNGTRLEVYQPNVGSRYSVVHEGSVVSARVVALDYSRPDPVRLCASIKTGEIYKWVKSTDVFDVLNLE